MAVKGNTSVRHTLIISMHSDGNLILNVGKLRNIDLNVLERNEYNHK